MIHANTQKVKKTAEEKRNQWNTKKKAAQAMAARLKATGEADLQKRGANMAQCSDILRVEKCPECGETRIASAGLCRDRLCPICRWRLSIKRYNEMLETMKLVEKNSTGAEYAFLTLTVKNCKVTKLRECVKEINEAWHRLMSRRSIKKVVKGWARSVECTYNKRGEFHPHVHVIVMFAPGTYSDAMLKDFKQAWKECLRISYNPIVDLRRIKAKDGSTKDIFPAILETFKYSVKDKDLDEMPRQAFINFARQFAGLRLVSFGGAIKEARALLGYKEDSPDEIEEIKHKCPSCSAEMQEALLQWSTSESVYNIYEGIKL